MKIFIRLFRKLREFKFPKGENLYLDQSSKIVSRTQWKDVGGDRKGGRGKQYVKMRWGNKMRFIHNGILLKTYGENFHFLLPFDFYTFGCWKIVGIFFSWNQSRAKISEGIKFPLILAYQRGLLHCEPHYKGQN